MGFFSRLFSKKTKHEAPLPGSREDSPGSLTFSPGEEAFAEDSAHLASLSEAEANAAASLAGSPTDSLGLDHPLPDPIGESTAPPDPQHLEQDTLEVDAPAGSEASSNPPEASALDKTQTLDETQPQDDGFQKAAPKTQAQIQETEDKLLSELDEYFKDEPFAGQDPGAPFLGSPVPEGFSPGADSPPDSFLGDTSFEWKFSETALNGEEPQEESGQASDPSGKDKSQVLILDEELPPPPDPDSEIGQLRNLLLERELRQLNRIASVMGDSQALAGTISQVVTEAILLRSHRDDKLNTVLAPTVEKIVSSSVRRNPEALANQIFPVIGPAIRKSISDSFSSMLQSFNNTLEMSLSLKGLKWRLEALRVHKPFSEIVLLHTLVYHVEEVYLIHAESGLILDHMVAEGGEARDTELVAAMFTAIRDFIRDSFSVDQKENLDNLRFGERTIYLLRADEVFMAAVVRGNPPAALTTELQAALELMVVDAANDLSEFKGEAQPFKKYRTFFEHFLVARYQDPKTIPFLVRKAPFIAILLVLIFLGTFWYENRNMRFHAQTVAETNLSLKALNGHSGKLHEKRITEILTRLNIVPGLAVGNVTKLQGGVLEIVCFKDELAPDPGLILTSDNGLKEGDFNLIIKPFVSMDPQIVLQRVEKAIPLPEGVSMNYNTQTGALTLAGEANLGWIISTRERALAIPGVNSLDFSNLTDPRTSQMQDLVNEINGVVIHFPLNKADPVPEDVEKLNRAVDNLAALERLCAEMQISVSLVIYGHADAIGQARRNYELSMERSFTVAALLYAKGSFMPIRNYGLGSRISGGGSPDSPDDPQEDPDMRRIELKVLVGSENTDPMAHISR